MCRLSSPLRWRLILRRLELSRAVVRGGMVEVDVVFGWYGHCDGDVGQSVGWSQNVVIGDVRIA